MEVYKSFSLEKFKEIVETRAKFQKVMLIYDENFSALQIEKLHNAIKEICIFNAVDIAHFGGEIYNGYKVLIFACCANSYLKLNANLDEFINIFLPQNQDILPFFIDSNFKSLLKQNNFNIEFNLQNRELNFSENNYIFLTENIDINIFYSFYFNNFFAQLKYIFLNENAPTIVEEDVGYISQNKMLEYLSYSGEFEDIKILKALKLDYKFLPHLNRYLLLAFYLLILGVEQNRLALVDIYKSAKDDYALLDKFYAKVYNSAFYQLIKLNFNNLKNCLAVGLKILSKFEVEKLPQLENELLIEKLKNFCKQSEDIFVYLYLFNIFGL